MIKAGIARLFAQRAKRKTCMPIGVEFAPERLHMVQCEQTEQGIAIRAATSMPYPAERSALLSDRKMLRKFVRAALDSAPFEGRRVHSTLPASDVRIVPLSMQIVAGQNEGAAVLKALREKLRTDFANDVIDYLYVRSGDVGGTESNVLAAVAPREKVLTHLDQLTAAGMEPAAIDIGPAALARLLAAMQRNDHDDSILLVNFGVEKSYITVVWGRRLILDREVEFGEARLIAKLVESLGVERGVALSMLQKHGASGSKDSVALMFNDIGRAVDEILHPEFMVIAEEISRTLVYIASKTRGKTAKAMYLNGSLIEYPYVVERMKKLVDVPIEILNPFDALPALNGPSRDPALLPAKGLALATGLALRG